jgi:hypothetical protein
MTVIFGFITLKEVKEVPREEQGEDKEFKLISCETIVALTNGPIQAFRGLGSFIQQREKVLCKLIGLRFDVKE